MPSPGVTRVAFMDERASALLKALPQRQLLEPAPGVSTLRQHLQAAAPGLAPMMLDSLAEAMQAKKKVRVEEPCPRCNCSHVRYVEINDAAASVNAVRAFMEQVEGR